MVAFTNVLRLQSMIHVSYDNLLQIFLYIIRSNNDFKVQWNEILLALALTFHYQCPICVLIIWHIVNFKYAMGLLAAVDLGITCRIYRKLPANKMKLQPKIGLHLGVILINFIMVLGHLGGIEKCNHNYNLLT